MTQLVIAVVSTIGTIIVAVVPFLFRLSKQNSEQHATGLNTAVETQQMLREFAAELRTGQAQLRHDVSALTDSTAGDREESRAFRGRFEDRLHAIETTMERRGTPRKDTQ